MTIDELAVYPKLSKSMLYHLARDGKVSGTKAGWHWRFHKEAIDVWIRDGRPPSQPYGRDVLRRRSIER